MARTDGGGAPAPEGPARAMLRALALTARESVPAFLFVFKVAFPLMLAIRAVEDHYPLVETLGRALEPVMGAVGLPGETGIPWAAAILVQPYAAYALLAEQWDRLELTVAQATVFGILVLEAHAILVEARIAQLLGCRAWFTCVLRFGAAVAQGMLFIAACGAFGWLQQPAEVLVLDTSGGGGGWGDWLAAQLRMWVFFAAVLYCLNLFMRAMRFLRVERVFVWALRPVMGLVGIHRSASMVGVVGLVLGLSFGAALLMAEAQSGRVPRRDIFLSVCLLGICHSVLEDTLLTALFGAHVAGVLLLRVAFALALVALLSRLLARFSDEALERWVMTRPKAPAPGRAGGVG